MNIVRILSLLIFVLIFDSCTNKKRNETGLMIPDKKLESVDSNSIPETIKRLVVENFPNYELPRRNEFHNDWKSYANDCNEPFFCTSDFNGDGKKDFCILLKSLENDIVKVVVFIEINGVNKCIELIELKVTTPISVVLSIAKKGTWEGIDETLNIENDGFTIYLVDESRNFNYYWDNDNFRQFNYD